MGFAVLAGWVLLVAALDCAHVQKLAVGIGAEASAVSATHLLASELCDPVVRPVVRLGGRRWNAISFARALASLALAFLARLIRVPLLLSFAGLTSFAFAVSFERARELRGLWHTRSGLEKARQISPDACELVEGVVKAPVLAVELGYDVPYLSVGCEQLLHVRAAKAEVLIKMLQAKLGHFLVKGFEVVEVCCATQGPCVSERLLNPVEPGCCDGSLLDGHFWRVVKEGCGQELGFCPQGLGGFGLHGFLVLLLAEAKLPGDPANALARLEAVVNNAQQAD